MTRAVVVVLSAFLASCYLSPDTHPEHDESAAPAGAVDAAVPSGRDAGTLEPPDTRCRDDQACPAQAPICRDRSCARCTQHADCSRFPETPACGPEGACVACAGDQKSLCAGSTPACDPATSQCVQCVDDADCPVPERAACTAGRTCGLCTDDADCARFGFVCEAESGTCVACRPATEQVDCRIDKTCNPATTRCAATACDPVRKSCTSNTLGSLSICRACVSDSECATDHRCIPLFFGPTTARQELGGFCMKIGSTGCAEPFRAPPIDGRTSLSGRAPEPYCGINETLTSCPAILALDDDKDCPGGMASSCDAPGARCAAVNLGPNECTYACTNNRECPVSAPCNGPAGAMYCGGSAPSRTP